jgi:UDP-2,3-diacylglucosamine hydrolase
MLEISLKKEKKIYFASDFHLGGGGFEQSKIRERLIIKWLDQIKGDAQQIYLVGDIFDLWFEYDEVVPKGFVRFLGKLAELTDSGIEIILFGGNHDLWQKDYFEKEIGLKYFRKPQSFTINNQSFFVAHGDGLADNTFRYKMLHFLFESKICNWLFRKVMPTHWGLKLGYAWANWSWKNVDKDKKRNDLEWDKKLVDYTRILNKTNPHNYFIFGHWHFLNDVSLSTSSRYINLGDWIVYNSYAVFDGEKLSLETFKTE